MNFRGIIYPFLSLLIVILSWYPRSGVISYLYESLLGSEAVILTLIALSSAFRQKAASQNAQITSAQGVTPCQEQTYLVPIAIIYSLAGSCSSTSSVLDDFVLRSFFCDFFRMT
jgi:hypothetical protein